MFKLFNKIGKIGEDTACMFLMKQGFLLVERNYWKKWGEIDIVAKKGNRIHFVEVKSVVDKKLGGKEENYYRPEENVHINKQKRLGRVISTYISEGEWQFDIIAVYLDPDRELAKIDFLENIIL